VWHPISETIVPKYGIYLFWAKFIDEPCVWRWSEETDWVGIHTDRRTYVDPFHYGLGYSHWAKVSDPTEEVNP